MTRLGLRLALCLVAVAAGAALWLVLDARQTPTQSPEYVALGSSYAAGAGLGPKQSGSPILCSRSVNGYPTQLARRLKLSFVDMTCSGAATTHVAVGGQFFQEAQIRVINRETKLVTITVGGNDIGFVRDLYLFAARNSDGTLGWLARHLWRGPPPLGQRGYAKLDRDLTKLLNAIRVRSPKATIVVATYPTVLPSRGTCPALGLKAREVEIMRSVEAQLASSTRSVAESRGAVVVDMHKLGAARNACSVDPWTRGWGSFSQSPFHPTVAGARETASAVLTAIRATNRMWE